MTLEIVAQSAEDAVAAERSGADRVELVSALSLGGLTPSLGLLQTVRARCALPIAAMLRPRSGGFAYSSHELDAMARDAERFVAEGAQGLVFGVLDARGLIDERANARLVAQGGEATFHRAFDVLPKPFEALEALIGLGFRRVLTSGGKPSALEGAETIRRLVERADGRIEILAGGGVRASNAAEIVARTGVDQLHSSALEWITDPSPTGLAFNGPAHPENRYARVDATAVAAVRAALSQNKTR